jgi:hypothetical protein
MVIVGIYRNRLVFILFIIFLIYCFIFFTVNNVFEKRDYLLIFALIIKDHFKKF